MTRLHAAADFPVLAIETPIESERTAAMPAPAIDTQNLHEAIITVLNEGDAKEKLEQVYLSREHHLRGGESMSLNERIDADHLHIQFRTLVSVQMVLADMKRRGLSSSDFAINWAN